MSRIIYILVFSILSLPTWGQDIRYSQYFNNPLTVNPALTGVGIDHLRASLAYRRQASGPANPFTTKGAFVDKSVGRFGLGFAINSNGAGPASVKTLQFAGSLSYSFHFGYKGNHRLAGGLQMGIIHKSIDPAKLTFDNQFQADVGFDPTIASGEEFEKNSIIRPSLSTGFFWKKIGIRKNQPVRPYLGYSALHLNQPDISFFGGEAKQQIKHVFLAGAEIRISDDAILKPNLVHIEQGVFDETSIGAIAAFQNQEGREIQAGLFGKMNKAFVVYAGFRYDRFLVGLSYDVMTGPVADAGKGYNAFELSLAFTPKSKPKVEQQKDVSKKEKENKPVVKQQEPGVKKPVTPPVVKTVKKDSTLFAQAPVITKEEKPESKKDVPPYVKEVKKDELATETTPIANVVAKETPVPFEISEVLQISRTNAIDAQPISTGVILPFSQLKEDQEEEAPMELPTVVQATEKSTPVIQVEPETASPSLVKMEPVETNAVISKPIQIVSQQEVQPIQTSVVIIHHMPKEDVELGDTQAEKTQPITEAATTPSTDKKEIMAEPVVEKAVPSVFSPIVPNNKIIAPDSDGDGVNDFEDPCPFIKGTTATRGCPDSDDDGIVDMVDFCPLESGPKSNGGCPVLNKRTSGDQQIIGDFDHILFQTGSVSLTIDNTYDIIEPAIELLYTDKSTFVLISGHTDSEGDAATNMQLSQKRADKVKSYFIGQGIGESRIRTIPYGENMPISGNNTESTRKLNRRVEITILKKGE
jgi:type IX secretion system PorP/SprF family membrane protein